MPVFEWWQGRGACGNLQGEATNKRGLRKEVCGDLGVDGGLEGTKFGQGGW